MLTQTRRFSSLFTSVAVLLTGHGLQLTLLPVRAQELGFSSTEIGLTGSAYFAGFLLGCLTVPQLIHRAGYIRTFSVTTTVCSSALLGVLFTNEVLWWSVLRCLTGWGISGAYLIVESWLNGQTPDNLRGRILALYTGLVLVAMCVGQGLIAFSPSALSIGPVVLGALLLSLAVIPTSLTRRNEPAPLASARFSFVRAYRNSPAAFGATVLIGMVTGVLFTLAPALARDQGLSLQETSFYMMAIVLGGAAFQLPAGRFSDHHDRRIVLIGLLVIGICAAIASPFLSHTWAIIATMFVLGGATISVYPICLAHANDRSSGNFLETGTAILLGNAAGSIVGPTAAAVALTSYGPSGFFGFVAVVILVTIIWLTINVTRRTALKESTEPFVPYTKTTQGTMLLDPRADHEKNPADELHPTPELVSAPTAAGVAVAPAATETR